VRERASGLTLIAAAAVIVVVAVLAVGLSQGAPVPVTRVLFVGNSYTSYNDGLDKQLERLAPSIVTERVTYGGFTLENHWTDGHALQAVHRGGWTYVVLQDQSVTPVLHAAEFYQYGRAFADEIRQVGASAVLLMTWERPDAVAEGVTSGAIEAAYDGLGDSIGARVAPAGTAFAASLRQRPDLALNLRDGHPTPYGTYLAGCVVYGTIFGITPVGNVAPDPGIPVDVQAYLQGIAARALGY